jgi:hypothetical protein
MTTVNSLKSMIENINIPSTTTITPVEESEDQFNECLLDFIDLNSNTETLDSELDLYLYLQTNVYYNPSDTILKFWEENKSKFPRLYIISKQLFSISATNLSSERNFSFAGLTLTDKRSTINPENVD